MLNIERELGERVVIDLRGIDTSKLADPIIEIVAHRSRPGKVSIAFAADREIKIIRNELYGVSPGQPKGDPKKSHRADNAPRRDQQHGHSTREPKTQKDRH